MFTDPEGLIIWKGTAINSGVSAGVLGITNIRFSLVSDCVNGSTAKVSVLASASGFSFGLRVTYLIGQSYVFEDGRELPSGDFSYNPDDGSGLDTSDFNGDFAITSGGVLFFFWSELGSWFFCWLFDSKRNV